MAATKSYTAQLAALYWMGLYFAERKGTLNTAQLAVLKQNLTELPAKMEEILSNSDAAQSLAQRLKAYADLVYIGRGINLASALEGALKLKEISYINANAYAAGELKHGPIALLDENMPVIAILGPGVTFAKMISNCEEAKARNAKVIAVLPTHFDVKEGLFDTCLFTPQADETTFPLLANIQLQLLAYYTADALGREVDQPRNLAKSVTVE